jgi:uncharacterized membrane protein YdbT with pleckstrin-like domain
MTEKTTAYEQNEEVLYDSAPSMIRNRPFLFILCVIIPVVGWIVLFFWWLKSVNIRLTATNERVTLRSGILDKNIREVFLSDIRSVQINQRFLQRILGTGHVEVSSAASSDAEIKVDGIPSAYKVKQIIDKYRRQSRRVSPEDAGD